MPDVPPYTLRQLAYLVAIEETGTVTAAASHMHVSPSALSDAITELEQHLGTRLCVRRRAHGATLTAAGRQVTRGARALLTQAQELTLSVSSSYGELAGPITIACYPTLAPTVLPPLLHEFGEKHPRVQLEILEITHDALEGRIESGEVDIAFVYETLVPGNPKRRRLFELPAHVLLSADDPLAAAPAVRLEDVVDRDLILLDATPSSDHTLSLFAARGLTPRIRHRTASFEAVRTLVGRGLGYGVLVQRPANPASYEGYPVSIKEITPAVPPVGIDVIWSALTPPSARVMALIEFANSIHWVDGQAQPVESLV